MTNTILPNAFQSPNEYVDTGMELLTPEEFKCLMFAARHILGWEDKINERQRIMSLTMFERGYTSAKTGRYFAGTGLSRAAIVKALAILVEGNLLTKLDETADGQRYELSDAPNWDYLRKRRDETLAKNRQRTANARANLSSKSDTPAAVSPTNQQEVSPTHQHVVSDTDQERLVAFTDAGQSDLRNQNQSLSLSPDSDSVDPVIDQQRESTGGRESTPTPFHIANGLGRAKPEQSNALVLAIEAHSVYKAFVRGWDGIVPAIERAYADMTWSAVGILQTDLDAKRMTLQDIENVTRWKLSNPKTQGYRIGFVKGDFAGYLAQKRALEKSSVKGAGLKPAPQKPVEVTPKGGVGLPWKTYQEATKSAKAK